MGKPMYDVICVSIDEPTILWVDGPHDRDNAEAVHDMAIARQGVRDRFFAYAQPKQYKSGDKWEGGVNIPNREVLGADPERGYDGIVKIGNMYFPNGPRGLQS